MKFCCTGLTTMAFQAKVLSHCFSKSYSMVMKLSKMLLQFCTVQFALRSIQLQLQLKGYKFMFSLEAVTFYCKKILQLTI